MSIIIDGMDQVFFLIQLFLCINGCNFLNTIQSHCKVPYNGTQGQFGPTALTQHITAIKEHGYGITIYRTLETVPKGANQTIYCILSQIEDWRNRHGGRYPEELFIQVDGGPENANHWVLGMLELLAVKRIVKTVWYTRLPTGHTHEDIDGVFAVMWKMMRDKTVLTLDEYVDYVTKTFTAKKYEIRVKTLMAIPDYKPLIDQVIDDKFGNLHHTIQTQHQWRFEVITFFLIVFEVFA